MAFSNGSTLVAPVRDAPRFGDELRDYLDERGHLLLDRADAAVHADATGAEPADGRAQR